MPVITVVIPRHQDADLTSPLEAIPFSAGEDLTLNISFDDLVATPASVTVLVTCSVLNSAMSSILPQDTIVESYTNTNTCTMTSSLTTVINTQSTITSGLLLLVHIIAFDGTQMGSVCQLFQVSPSFEEMSD